MDIEKCLNKYSDEYYSSMFRMNDHHDVIQSMELSKRFLYKYAMDDKEYRDSCLPVLQKVFRVVPSVFFDIREKAIGEMFHDNYSFFAYQSSPLFWKESYDLILRICKDCGDNNIFIVEDERCEPFPEMAFKIRLPVECSWENISHGGIISDVLFNMFNNNYYVFGDSGFWGKWCDYDNDYIDYEAFTFASPMSSVTAYKNYFSISKQEFKGLSSVPGNLRVGFWNNIKWENAPQMIYFCFGKKRTDSFRNFLMSAINNTICTKGQKAKKETVMTDCNTSCFYIEYDINNSTVVREIGTDENNKVVTKGPYKNNLGFWIDNDLTLQEYKERFDIHSIGKETFDKLWESPMSLI